MYVKCVLTGVVGLVVGYSEGRVAVRDNDGYVWHFCINEVEESESEI
jgi:hypothetical protein